MNDALYAGDKLLDAWLSLTSTLWNTRLVSSMTYNEAHVLGLLLRHEDDPAPMTATVLISIPHRSSVFLCPIVASAVQNSK